MVVYGSRGRVIAAFLLAFAVNNLPAHAIAQGQRKQPTLAQIDRNGVLILVRTTLLAVHAANETGNYTVLRDLGTPGFQQANTASRLSEIFASLRGQNLDLSGIAVLEPQLTLLPQIEGEGWMHLAGFFPSVPLQINFELLYAPVNGRWRVQGISVGLGNSGPVAPQPPSSAPSQPPSQTKEPDGPPKTSARPEAPKTLFPRPAPSSPAKPVDTAPRP